jgi:hypothetical protein
MFGMRLHATALASLFLLGGTTTTTALAAPKATCPPTVTAAATKAVANATITSCHAEREDGIDKFEVKLTRNDHSTIELDVSPDGKILATEEPIALAKLPAAVTTAFATRYPTAKPTSAVKEDITGRGTFFELTYTSASRSREATFKLDGTFVGDE